MSRYEFVVDNLLQNVVVEVIVAGHRQEGAKANPDGVKDLSCSIHPHLKHRSPLITRHHHTDDTNTTFPGTRIVGLLLWSCNSLLLLFLTSSESSLSHSGTMKNFIPSNAPGSCALLISRAIRITYGKRAVKYTTCTHTETHKKNKT